MVYMQGDRVPQTKHRHRYSLVEIILGGLSAFFFLHILEEFFKNIPVSLY
jgi:hypothetical protein